MEFGQDLLKLWDDVSLTDDGGVGSSHVEAESDLGWIFLWYSDIRIEQGGWFVVWHFFDDVSFHQALNFLVYTLASVPWDSSDWLLDWWNAFVHV